MAAFLSSAPGDAADQDFRGHLEAMVASGLDDDALRQLAAPPAEGPGPGAHWLHLPHGHEGLLLVPEGERPAGGYALALAHPANAGVTLTAFSARNALGFVLDAGALLFVPALTPDPAHPNALSGGRHRLPGLVAALAMELPVDRDRVWLIDRCAALRPHDRVQGHRHAVTPLAGRILALPAGLAVDSLPDPTRWQGRTMVVVESPALPAEVRRGLQKLESILGDDLVRIVEPSMDLPPLAHLPGPQLGQLLRERRRPPAPSSFGFELAIRRDGARGHEWLQSPEVATGRFAARWAGDTVHVRASSTRVLDLLLPEDTALHVVHEGRRWAREAGSEAPRERALRLRYEAWNGRRYAAGWRLGP